ncbi:MAG TPA: head-tail connector protein [Devosiaceae bacterium]|jgi:uncharacterized phiE125 gp8 family phage protein|nr:head-tail connector protein [Devosiaceae bacterium]
MTAYLLAGPAAEPLTPAEAKAFLRLDDEAEDALVETLITAARLHVEGTSGRALLAQSWRLVLDGWPADGIIKLPVSPLITLTGVTAYDTGGAPHGLALAQFRSEPSRLLLPDHIAGTPVLRPRQGLEIDYVAGYGVNAGDVPADLRSALLMLVAYWFEHRDSVVAVGAGATLPTGFDRLLAPYRRVRL